jgi:PEP-CTERM motif
MILRAAVLTTWLFIGAIAPAVAAVIAPDQPVNGLSQTELSARWWQWMITYPASTNPALDTTGEHSSLGSDQTPVSHPGIFFLAGNFTGFESRTVVVTNDQSLFFPFINTASFIPFFGNTEAEIRTDAAATLGTVSGLFARLDGVDLPLPSSAGSLLDYRQQSALFSLTFPADNIFGVLPDSYESVADGYWLALGPLAPGQYTLEFGASATGTPPVYPAFSLAQQYVITVVPEPATWGLLLAGLFGIGVARRRGRH